MEILLSDEKKMNELNRLQNSITVTSTIQSGTYMCDCTGCSNGCFEFCSDGHGPAD